jgi:hypothetical protein
MNSPEKKNHRLNFSLTRRVIELQAKGYHFDYHVLCNQQLLCAQSNQEIPVYAVLINVVDQVYDRLRRTFKYIHTIDTGNGEMGVLITDAIVTNDLVA